MQMLYVISLIIILITAIRDLYVKNPFYERSANVANKLRIALVNFSLNFGNCLLLLNSYLQNDSGRSLSHTLTWKNVSVIQQPTQQG